LGKREISNNDEFGNSTNNSNNPGICAVSLRKKRVEEKQRKKEKNKRKRGTEMHECQPTCTKKERKETN